ncbi:MAG TPA: PIN domain nuclease, partial [Gemmobacter sp.]|nr:PIN domain nuclease [Gemmobacter sp.]
KAEALMADPDNQLVFSAVNIWEVVVKHGLKRPDFNVDALVFRRQLLDAGYEEIPVTSLHALELAGLPLIHRDPFDRLLIAQAMAEGMRLLTADRQIAFYPGPVLKV